MLNDLQRVRDVMGGRNRASLRLETETLAATTKRRDVRRRSLNRARRRAALLVRLDGQKVLDRFRLGVARLMHIVNDRANQGRRLVASVARGERVIGQLGKG